MDKRFSGLQRAITAITAARPGLDPVDELASALGVKRKTVLNWLREDGTPLGGLNEPPNNRVSDAVNKAGGVPAMARTLGVTPQAVREWVRYGYVPARRAQEIDVLYGIPREELVSPKLRSSMGLGGDL